MPRKRKLPPQYIQQDLIRGGGPWVNKKGVVIRNPLSFKGLRRLDSTITISQTEDLPIDELVRLFYGNKIVQPQEAQGLLSDIRNNITVGKEFKKMSTINNKEDHTE